MSHLTVLAIKHKIRKISEIITEIFLNQHPDISELKTSDCVYMLQIQNSIMKRLC